MAYCSDVVSRSDDVSRYFLPHQLLGVEPPVYFMLWEDYFGLYKCLPNYVGENDDDDDDDCDEEFEETSSSPSEEDSGSVVDDVRANALAEIVFTASRCAWGINRLPLPMSAGKSTSKKRRSKKSKKRREERSAMICVFCKNNGEKLSVYSSHILHDEFNNTVCPVLRKYICPYCRKTGDEAHTKKYCPMNPNKEPDEPALMTRLKAGRTAAGKRKSRRR